MNLAERLAEQTKGKGTGKGKSSRKAAAATALADALGVDQSKRDDFSRAFELAVQMCVDDDED